MTTARPTASTSGIEPGGVLGPHPSATSCARSSTEARPNSRRGARSTIPAGRTDAGDQRQSGGGVSPAHPLQPDIPAGGRTKGLGPFLRARSFNHPATSRALVRLHFWVSYTLYIERVRGVWNQ